MAGIEEVDTGNRDQVPLPDAYIETVAESLASLLVAEYRARHPRGQSPWGIDHRQGKSRKTTCSQAESGASRPDNVTGGHRPAP